MIDQTKLKAFINELGWSSYGVITAEQARSALAGHEGIYEDWVKKGFQADMNYLSAMKEDRFHPENKLPDVKSIVVLMAWYGYEQKNCSKNEGKVARYAAGRDYHKVLKKKLLGLADWLKEADSGAECYLSVDSGPTVDRVLAQAAGIGFFGKNANLIDPRRGSYFFIACLLTNLELPLTEKQRMPGCGSCQRCIVACPTDAIVAPGAIDARRCISYLTIENKGEIPKELREKVGDRLFGCDICQEVCPFNEGRAGRQEIRIEDLQAKDGVGEALDLSEILAIETDDEFTERFKGTPLMRAKRKGLIRNACIVAGNSENADLLPALEAVINRESDPMLRESADWAIAKIRKGS